MSIIEASVGQDADNQADDVLIVQRLINRHDLKPLHKIKENGEVGNALIQAIRLFQSVYVGLTSPDGRVDPGGRTLRKLNAGSRASPLPKRGETPQTRRDDRDARSRFVDPRVKETGVTSRILDALTPKFDGVRARVISGYLSDTDLFWKVNYHWDYLRDMLEHALTLPLGKKSLEEISHIRSTLLSASPDPRTGYLNSPLGKPEDKSSMQEMTRRHSIVSQAKREFKALTSKEGLKKLSSRPAKAFDYAVAPVAHPGTSKHGSGYAVDIEGDNATIKNLCKGAGATLVFDEKSHVHVEFRNGVGAG